MRIRAMASVVAMAGGLLAGCDSSSDFETYVATVDGAQEVPTRSSAGSGSAVVLVSRDGDRADVSVSFNGGFAPTQAHIHRAPAGTNGPVIFWLYDPRDPVHYPSFTQIGKTWFNPSTDSRDVPFDAAALADLRAGNLYVNFHSTAFPGGEIRGQLKKQ